MQIIIDENFLIPEQYAGQRIDSVLAALLPQYSRASIQKWMKLGALTVNNNILTTITKVKGGEKISLKVIPPAQQASNKAQPLTLDICYEDTALMIINKPVGLVVHPAPGHQDNTLVNGLLHHHAAALQLPRAGLIHRLDKDTSGLLLIAKTLPAYQYLSAAMQARKIKRSYRALVQGCCISGGTIDKPIARDGKNRQKQAISKNGRQAITHYKIRQRFKHYTELTLQLETGRTHQIRVHLASVGFPIVGDSVYGRHKQPRSTVHQDLKQQIQHFSHQALHAYQLAFQHPLTEEILHVSTEPPADYLTLLTALTDLD